VDATAQAVTTPQSTTVSFRPGFDQVSGGSSGDHPAAQDVDLASLHVDPADALLNLVAGSTATKTFASSES
jgi:hypothetical protein